MPEPPRAVLLAGLLRDTPGLSFGEIAAPVGCAHATAWTAVRDHARALRADPAYTALAARVVHDAVRRDFGPPTRLFDLPRRLPEAGIAVDAPELGFVGTAAVENR